MLASGLLNKQVAYELEITEYTVQLHRGHIMRKMEADSFAALVRMADKVRLHLQTDRIGVLVGGDLRTIPARIIAAAGD